MSPIRAIAGAPAEYGNGVSGQHRLGPLPTNPIQHHWGITLELPICHLAVLVLHIHEEVKVRVRPLNAGYDACQRDGFVAIVLRPKRVMRKGRYGNGQPGYGKSNNRPSFHMLSPNRYES